MFSAPSRFNNSELWGGIAGFALGAFTARAGSALGIGGIHDPGSGFMLFYTGLVMCALAASLIVTAFSGGGPSVAGLWQGARWSKPVAIIAALIVFAAALEPLGFLATAIPLMLVLLRAIDPVRWRVAIPIAIFAPLVMWWLLKKLLLIQLPSGLWGIG